MTTKGNARTDQAGRIPVVQRRGRVHPEPRPAGRLETAFMYDMIRYMKENGVDDVEWQRTRIAVLS